MTEEMHELSITIKGLENRLETLRDRRAELYKEERDINALNAERVVLGEITKAEINYTLGHSQGFVNGYSSAIEDIIQELSVTFDDSNLTVRDLYAIVALGQMKERAVKKNFKSMQTARDSGWEESWTRKDGTPTKCMTWKKKVERDG